LVPAGTGFRTYQESEVRIRPQALDALSASKASLSKSFPLLDAVEDGGDGKRQPAARGSAATSLEALLGGAEKSKSED